MVSDAEWENRLEALFSSPIPEPDPRRAVSTEDQQVEARSAGSVQGSALKSLELGAGRPGMYRVLLFGSIAGEGAAAIALLAMLYRSSPRALWEGHFRYASIALACTTFVLLFVQWQIARRLSQSERLVQAQAAQLKQAGVAIQRRQKVLELTTRVVRRQRMRLSLCTEVWRLVAQDHTPDTFAEQVVQEIEQYFRPCLVRLYVLDSQQREATVLAAVGDVEGTAAPTGRLAVSDSTLLRVCVDRGLASVVQDVRERCQEGGDLRGDRLLATQTGSAIVVPVMVDAWAIGSIVVQTKDAGPFDELDVAVLTLVAGLVAFALSRPYLVIKASLSDNGGGSPTVRDPAMWRGIAGRGGWLGKGG